MALPLALALAPSLFKAGAGIVQSIRGSRTLADAIRPEYEIPDATKSNLAIANADVADTGYGGMSRDLDLAMLSARMATDQAVAQGNPNAASIIQAGLNRDLGRISATAQRQQEQDRLRLMRANQAMAAAEDRQYQEEFDAFADKFQLGQDMIGAGAKNMFGGLDSMTAALITKL